MCDKEMLDKDLTRYPTHSWKILDSLVRKNDKKNIRTYLGG